VGVDEAGRGVFVGRNCFVGAGVAVTRPSLGLKVGEMNGVAEGPISWMIGVGVGIT